MPNTEVYHRAEQAARDVECAKQDAGWLAAFSKAAEVAETNPRNFNAMIADFNAGRTNRLSVNKLPQFKTEAPKSA